MDLSVIAAGILGVLSGMAIVQFTKGWRWRREMIVATVIAALVVVMVLG